MDRVRRAAGAQLMRRLLDEVQIEIDVGALDHDNNIHLTRSYRYTSAIRGGTAVAVKPRAPGGVVGRVSAASAACQRSGSPRPHGVQLVVLDAHRLLLERYATGQESDRTTAEWLNAKGATPARGRRFGADTVREMLLNASYCGYVTGLRDQSREIRGRHKPIVPEELFDRMQEIRRWRTRVVKQGRGAARRLRSLLGDRGEARRTPQAARPAVRPHLAGRRPDRRRDTAKAVRPLLPSRDRSGVSKAGATGLEPATSGVTGQRSNRLSYAPSEGA